MLILNKKIYFVLVSLLFMVIISIRLINAQIVSKEQESNNVINEFKSEEDKIISINFNNSITGNYTFDNVKDDFKSTWADGVKEKRANIVDENNKFLRIFYPKGHHGTDETGALWRTNFDESYDELYMTYKIRFKENFDFVKGGKLPGLAGGEGNTGGNKPNGYDGWSARLMWRKNGAVVQYVYYPDQTGKYADDFAWDKEDQKYFQPGKWHTITNYIKINTLGKKDGEILGWFDGELALESKNLLFRNTDDFSIDQFQFSTFFGGSGDEWNTTQDEWVDFDDIKIYKKLENKIYN
ncbi:MAG: polysaccharide lyase [Clostridiales bacterium]